MKKSTFLRSLLTLLVMAVWVGANGAMAQATYTHTFKTGDLGTANNVTTSPAGSKTLSNVTWDFTLTKKNANYYLGWDSAKGVQIGSSKQPATQISLSTSEIPGTITSIVVNTSGASSIKATVNVSVGGTVFSPSSVSLTSTATDYTFEGSAEGEVVLSWANTSSKAIYIKSISITYTTSSSVTPTASAPTFTPDGGTVEKGSTVSLACGTEGATIYYAIDAADPETAIGTAYTTPITINEDCSITAWAEAAGMDASVRVTKDFVAATYIDFQKANNVVSGQKYLLYADGKIATLYSGANSYAYLPVEEVTLTDETIKLLGETNTLTFTETSGGYTIQNSNGDYYCSTSTHNTISFAATLPDDGSEVWSVEPQADGTLKITNVVTGKYLQYSTTYTSYGAYSDTQGVLPTLYTNGADLGVAVTKQEQTLAFSSATCVVEEGEEVTEPELTGAMTAVTYSSSDTGVATVNESTGEVTVVGVGTTTITANAAADETYYAASASYTLTVNQNLAGITLPYMMETKVGDDNYGGIANLPGGSIIDGVDAEDYKSSTAYNSRLKFKATGANLTFKLADSPATLSYIIKSNSFAGGTFTVETSIDGSSYTTLKTYTKAVFDEAGSDVINEIHLPLNAEVRYIRWTYTSKSSGNIGLGSIYITKQGDATSMPLSISAAKYATFFSDKAIVMPEGVSGNIVTIDGAQANLTEEYVAGDIVPANTPLMLSAEQGTYDAPFTAATNTQNAANLLKGALTNDVITAPAGSLLYIFANDSESGLGFYWQKNSNNGQQVQNMAGKAYLQVPTTSAVKGFRLNLGDTTGITAVESALGNAPVYTLSGVRVNGSLNNLPAGIYIVGGKKVYVK